MDLKEEEILGDKIYGHWYYIAKGRSLLQFLKGITCKELLDVGAGSGIFSKQLLDVGFCDSAVCVDPGYEEETKVDHNGKSIEFVKSIDKTSQNLVLMMDVLEHVEDDVGLLTEYSETMEEGGYILITVPAFKFLWSGHDVFLEHFRRYTDTSLRETVEKSGLKVVKSRYFFGSLFPMVALIRLLKKLLLRSGQIEAKSEISVYPEWLNKTLIGIHDIERHSLFHVNKIAGLSIFCLCRK